GRWDSNTGQFISFWNSQNSNIDSSGVMDIVKRGDTVWVGTGGSGVSWLNGNVWTRVYLSTGEYHFASNNVKAMTVDIQGNLWVASEYGLRKFAAGSNSTFTVYLRENSPLPSNGVLDVEADPTGGIWIATYTGLARFDGTNWTTYNQANTGMPGPAIFDVARRQSDGLIAIANYQGSTFPYTGGVSTFDGNTWTHYTPENSPLTHRKVTAVEFDRNGNLWASPMSEGVVQIMIGASSHAAPFDFDGDGKTDISIFRSSVAEWWWRRSSDNMSAAAQFGASTDNVAPADFTGDGKTDIAFFRPSTGQWFILRSEDSSYTAFPFGTNGDIPVPADYDGDGKADPAVFRPSNSVWYIQRSGDGQVAFIQFGTNGDRPVAADYDGDGRADVAIYRPSAGDWWIQRSTAGLFAAAFGSAADKTVQGDYTGDGKADIALWRPATGTWYILRSEDQSFYSYPFGVGTDLAVPGDYDGDGKFDAGIFRPSAATWIINRSTAGPVFVGFGIGTDQPIPNAFVR
ncbi:MAG TPA: FG-GAP-like repeat-containing protein, partial [Candidatus Limnocylindria bacterium]|nr:FG-GAP-like repeat-containing protein [Candidatus Limnocylindria bacterium]